jgi:hypothetical protein
VGIPVGRATDTDAEVLAELIRNAFRDVAEHGDLPRWYAGPGFRATESRRFPHLPFDVARLELEPSMRILERYFDALRDHDWQGLGECLAADVRRTGPFLDVVRGRRAYVEFLAAVVPTLENYALTVAGTHRLGDGSALVLLSETLDMDGVATEFPEALRFGFDDDGRILQIDVYIQDPTRNPARGRASGAGTADERG